MILVIFMKHADPRCLRKGRVSSLSDSLSQRKADYFIAPMSFRNEMWLSSSALASGVVANSVQPT